MKNNRTRPPSDTLFLLYIYFSILSWEFL